MPVTATHPEYDARISEWQRCRDAADGEDAVKARGDTYLPKLSGQGNAAYKAYVKRASYYEAVGRTVDGFTGSISRKPPKIAVPAKIEGIVEDASGSGVSLSEFLKRLCRETILMARGGLLVDVDSRGAPYFVLYPAESIVNWWDETVILKETVYEPDADDRFKRVAVEQYRELALVAGAYTVTIWRKLKDEETGSLDWRVHQVINPVSRGKPLTEIPFFWINPLGRANEIERPPLLGMVNISMSHYRTSADLEHGRHFTGLPTLYVLSDQVADDTVFHVGAESAIMIRDSNARVGYAEFTGQGLASLERAQEHKEMQMAALGAAVFQAAQRKGVEAAETARIRLSGENSLLMGVVAAIEESVESALKFAARWVGTSDSAVSVKLNRDFIASYLEPQALQGLVAAFQAGALSLDSFLYVLQSADMIPAERDLKEEKEVVVAEATQRAATQAALDVKVKGAGSPSP